MGSQRKRPFDPDLIPGGGEKFAEGASKKEFNPHPNQWKAATLCLRNGSPLVGEAYCSHDHELQWTPVLTQVGVPFRKKLAQGTGGVSYVKEYDIIAIHGEGEEQLEMPPVPPPPKGYTSWKDFLTNATRMEIDYVIHKADTEALKVIEDTQDGINRER
ncbi:hypothetical protein SEA_LITTLEFELLA_87 [Gordonia phage LittleFella]|nr:hypothetical protein SEA_LITTLEFELLA_87 [Gordonia phage LittleFella]